MVEPRVAEKRGRKVADASRRPDGRTANRRVITESRRSSGGAMIEVKQSPQPLGFAKDTCLAPRSLVGERDDIIESLVIAFVPMVGQILLERVAQGTFAEENHLVKALLLDRAHPAFGESIEIG